MRVLVTGATGFIGSHLCAMLATAGYEVAVLSRNPDGARKRLPNITAAYPWQPLEGPPPTEAFQGVNAVVNLAGESVAGRWTSSKKRRIYDSRVIGTRNLVTGIEQASERPQVLVSGSAHGYYGDRGEAELTENSPPGNDFLSRVCKDWEAAAMAAESFGVRVVRNRTGLVVGEGGGMLGPLVPMFKFGIGGPLGGGKQWWSWVHHEDVSRFIIHALEDDTVRGPMNLASPTPLRQREFAKVLGRVLRRPALLPAPKFALKLILGEFSIELLGSKRLVPKSTLASGYAFTHPHLEPALRDVLGRH